MPYPAAGETREDFFLRMVRRQLVQDGDHLLWRGGVNHNGYPETSFNYKRIRLHIKYYEITVGPVPKGLKVDHSCGIKRCVAHLEAITQAENLRRARVRKYGADSPIRCPHGHEYTEENTYWQKHKSGTKSKHCIQCDREAHRRPRGE